MLFRLHDMSVVSVPDHVLDLSVFLSGLKDKEHPLFLARRSLKNSGHESLRKASSNFVHVLKEAMEHLFPNQEELKEPLNKLYTFVSCDKADKLRRYTNQIEDKDSLLWHHMTTITNNDGSPEQREIDQCMEYLQQNAEAAFEKPVHHLAFISDDETLLKVFEFLKIECPTRHAKMFSAFPGRWRNVHPSTDMKSAIEPEFHPYLDFMRSIDHKKLNSLIKASSELGIRPLQQLLGLLLSEIYVSMGDEHIRKLGEVDDTFRDPIHQQLQKIMASQEWLES